MSTGQLLENTVFNQLSHYKIKVFDEVNYYRTQKGNEIDFILNKEYAFEVKQKATKYDIENIRKISSELKLKKYYVVSEKFAGYKDKIIYPQFL